ncbi:MAG: transcriptional regulator [Prevotella sp.]|nr:transcriptional regulator [Prevotella sp.]
MSQAYNDSLEQISKRQTVLFLQRRCIALCADGRYDEAMTVNNQWKERVEPGTIGYSLMAYYRAEMLGSRGQTQEQKYWLAVSAITEVTSCDMNLSALWKLAEIIYAEGDIDRAVSYIDFSWNSISRFSTHKRAWLMAPIMNDIYHGYRQKITSTNRQLFILALAVGLLACFLMLAFFYATRERRYAVDARAELQQKNLMLSNVNAQLHDSNRVKDEYIRNFLQMCSTYIDKMDNYRLRINRKLKANQVKDVLQLTDSEQMRQDERTELMAHFDAVFLHLFPTFINDFNRLLQPEARVEPDEPGGLNTLLRIFALVRLGIDESSKIAEFLGYSANSIYNYRSRIKRQAIGDRADFEAQVRTIGL